MIRVLLLFSVCYFVINSTSLHADSFAAADTFPTIEELVGTDLRYKIAFLWMDHVADGFFSLEKGEQSNTYRARLSAKTRGVSAWLTSHRIQSYETLMQKQEHGNLITLTHDSSIEKGKGKSKKIRIKHYAFDPDNGEISVSKIADGVQWWEKHLPFAAEMPVDILTAYANLITGVYGPLIPGLTYEIPAFGGTDVGLIKIEILTDRQRPDSNFFPKGGMLCRFSVDKEIFDTKEGTIYVWYDRAGNPARGVIESIVGMGDIRGVMR